MGSSHDLRVMARDLRQGATLCLSSVGQSTLLGLALRAETLATEEERLAADLRERVIFCFRCGVLAERTLDPRRLCTHCQVEVAEERPAVTGLALVRATTHPEEG